MIGNEALMHDFGAVIIALHQSSAALTATHDAGKVVDVDRERFTGALTDAPPAQPAHHFFVGNFDSDHHMQYPIIVCQHCGKTKRLAHGARVTVEQNALLRGQGFQTGAQDPIHQRVGRQVAAFEQWCNFASDPGAGADLGAQQCAGGDRNQWELMDEFFGNCALSCAGAVPGARY